MSMQSFVKFYKAVLDLARLNRASTDGRLRKFDKVTILLITGCALSMNLPTDYLKDTTCIVKCESPRLNPLQPEK